jgi:molybdopterin/thiamine biosynthesis adenylyltransferase
LSAALDLFVPGRTACAECRLQVDEDGDDANSRIVDQLRVGGDRGTSPCISPVAGLLGSLAALETMKFLTGVADTVLLDHQVVVDLLGTQVHQLPDRPAPGCPACTPSTSADPALVGVR